MDHGKRNHDLSELAMQTKHVFVTRPRIDLEPKPIVTQRNQIAVPGSFCEGFNTATAFPKTKNRAENATPPYVDVSRNSDASNLKVSELMYIRTEDGEVRLTTVV